MYKQKIKIATLGLINHWFNVDVVLNQCEISVDVKRNEEVCEVDVNEITS